MPGGAAARPVERVRTSSSGAGRRDSVSFSGSTDTDVYSQTTAYHIHNIAPASRSCCPLRNYQMGATNIIYVSDCECLSVSIAAAVCCDLLSSVNAHCVLFGFRDCRCRSTKTTPENVQVSKSEAHSLSGIDSLVQSTARSVL